MPSPSMHLQRRLEARRLEGFSLLSHLPVASVDTSFPPSRAPPNLPSFSGRHHQRSPGAHPRQSSVLLLSCDAQVPQEER
uniref:Uncharacterized protein n=1 Tax=Panagrellus redivivus TaxID=6233 RepID=A0A7E4VLC4_PANRE